MTPTEFRKIGIILQHASPASEGGDDALPADADQPELQQRRIAITESREDSEAMQVLLARYAAMLDAIDAHVALLDHHGKIVAVNRAWKTFAAANALQDDSFGIGTNYLSLCDGASGSCGAEAQVVSDGIRAVLSGVLPRFQIDYPCHSPQERRWFCCTVLPVGDNGADGAVVLHADVTQDRLATEAKDRARCDAEQADRLKSAFLAKMSHELRTPLNAIIGFADIMAHQLFGDLGNPRYLSYATDIKRSGDHLLGIMSDLLDLSRIEADELPLHEEWSDLGELLQEAAQIAGSSFGAQGVRIKVLSVVSECRVFVDRRRIMQILLNLLSNSLKFSDSMVNVTASFNKQELVISVADEGRGIPKDMIPQAMKPFQRLSGLTRDPQEGAGLGLSIAARLAEAHGGKLQIDSEVAVGTTVYLRLRAERFMVVTP